VPKHDEDARFLFSRHVLGWHICRRAKFKDENQGRFQATGGQILSIDDFRFGGLTPKPEMEIRKCMGEFVAPAGCYLAI